MSTEIGNDSFDNSYFLHHLPQLYKGVLKNFRKIVQSFILFHLLFFFVIGSEIVIGLPFIGKSILSAFALGAFFITIFSYLVLFFYFQIRKGEKLSHLKKECVESCRMRISFPAGEPEHHLSIAEALINLATYLEDFEKNFYKVPSFLEMALPVVQSLSCRCYWKDVFKLKEMLLSAAVEEHLKQIRITPTDIEVHTSLATTYVCQAKLFRSFRKLGSVFEEKFQIASRLAIEEFQILYYYAPNDPWIHEQLALGFRELKMAKEELAELESLYKLRPQDKEVIFRLGELCFHQGMNAKGLQIYEKLKESNFKKAEDLIACYGQYQSEAN